MSPPLPSVPPPVKKEAVLVHTSLRALKLRFANMVLHLLNTSQPELFMLTWRVNELYSNKFLNFFFWNIITLNVVLVSSLQ